MVFDLSARAPTAAGRTSTSQSIARCQMPPIVVADPIISRACQLSVNLVGLVSVQKHLLARTTFAWEVGGLPMCAFAGRCPTRKVISANVKSREPRLP